MRILRHRQRPRDVVLAPRARVSVVDDEDQVRTIVARTPAELGYHVTEARQGEDALRPLETSGGGACDAVSMGV